MKAIVLALAWGLCALYGAVHLDHRWIPHDEGTLAHSAERVAQGELPHVDFDEPYTGGLSFVGAAAFELLGPRLIGLRLVLYATFLAWVATLLWIGTRFLPPVAAGLVALAAVAWGMPNYAAAMPSWYNLFFATFGTAALLREADTGQRRWLWIAGGFAGLSVTFKIVGLYFIAAGLLHFVHREAGAAGVAGAAAESGAATAAPAPAERRGAPGARAYSIFVSAGLILFLLAVARVVGGGGAGAFFEFVLPLAALTAVILHREWRAPAGAFGMRLRRLLGLIGPFIGGAAIPIVAFALPYLLSGSADALVRGVFVLPTKRLDFATQVPAGWARWLGVAVLVAVLGVPLLGRLARRSAAVALAAIALAALLLAGRDDVYRAVFLSMTALVPLAATAAALPLWRWDASADPPARSRRDGLFLLLAAAATWNLVRYPFSGPIYYFYVVPLLLLALAAFAVDLPAGRRRALAGAIGFYALFAVLWIGTGSLQGILEERSAPAADDFLPPIERAGLRMTRQEAAQYTFLVQTVRAHARGAYVYATPDAPEVYFLTGMRNPTRTIFDFFDEPEGRTPRVLDALRRAQVDVVVLKDPAPFSGPVPPDLLRALEARYPRAQALGMYTVRWRP